MSTRIWFVQQQPFDFMPLKAGLGIITEGDLKDYEAKRNNCPDSSVGALCPKIYTTRTRPMAGEYQVVRGSRFKAVPLDPPIEFQVKSSVPFNLKDLSIPMSVDITGAPELHKNYTIPELDLGVVGTTAETLRDELLKSYKKATIDTLFYINKLEPINNG
jgi:hypothetical protein